MNDTDCCCDCDRENFVVNYSCVKNPLIMSVRADHELADGPHMKVKIYVVREFFVSLGDFGGERGTAGG